MHGQTRIEKPSVAEAYRLFMSQVLCLNTHFHMQVPFKVCFCNPHATVQDYQP